MAENIILDCYTDEPSGLGVPPYIGTYPRYIAGKLIEEEGKIPYYITIDDLRKYLNKESKNKHKTDVRTYNLTINYQKIQKLLNENNNLIIIVGVHTPGKYLSAVPGTLSEIAALMKSFKCKKILTGPAIFGSQAHGGKFSEKIPKIIDEIKKFDLDYSEIDKFCISGAEIIKQIKDERIAEIETGKGCSRKIGCSFCTEPLKNKLEFRKKEKIVEEINNLADKGIKNFRLGKQSDFYSYPDAIQLLKEIRKNKKVEILHIDNVNPAMVITKKGEEITKAITKYCSDGNVAAFGVESFDKKVIKSNNLNSSPEKTIKAIEIINRYGKEKGERGLPKFLPGINILFGLIDESKITHEENMKYFKMIIEKGFLIRRINIRQVVPFEGTFLHKNAGNKFLRKNRKYYWKWRNEIRQNIDFPILKKLVPEGSVLKNAKTEIHDGNNTFCRQVGTYPLIIGVKEKLNLREEINVKVKGHMLRSIIGVKI